MKIPLFVLSAALLVSGASGAATFADFAPAAQEATVNQPLTSGEVIISFNLGAPAIVTIDVLTNATDAADGWVSVGQENLSSLSGPVNRLVAETGAQTVVWTPEREAWSGLSREDVARIRIRPGRLRAVVTTWSPKCPPEFMVVDLAHPSMVRYYAARTPVETSIPGGLTDERYKTDFLVLRRCDAGRFHEGASTEPAVWNMSIRPGHSVSLTRDFYMGIFEFTQGQYKALTGKEWNCWFGKARRPDDYLKLPIDGGTGTDEQGCGLSYEKLRGTDFAVGVVAEGTLLAELRAKLGLAVDLPTVAQWERAYRGGESEYSSFPDGLGAYADTSSEETKARAARFCWYEDNSAINGEKQPHVVGTREPNPWGLYDMGGNVFEYCRDPLPAYDGSEPIGATDPNLAWYAELAANPEKAVDPDAATAATATSVVAITSRGGSFHMGVDGVAAFAHVSAGSTSWSNCKNGFRLCLELTSDEADNL